MFQCRMPLHLLRLELFEPATTTRNYNPSPPFPFRFYLIYLTLVLHGIGTLMPWNMFITAKEVRTRSTPK